ncbi:Mov34/MPN/PAD-1 family protein [Noviluteimonas gilva]|nr:Mov34/MPN/PAD-1 family protein [Lysobacter gilvus]
MPRGIQQDLEELARDWEPLEVGGVLAGYWNGQAAIVTDFVGPGNDAQHHRYTFVPDDEYHVDEIARLYRESNGATTYLGDWHTHPSGTARLSPLDKRTLRRIANAPEARCPDPLMVLFAGSGHRWGTQVFTLGATRSLLPRSIVPVELRIF